MTLREPKPLMVAHTSFDERNGQFSPDGRWVAYQTNESGRFEIVVQRFPDGNGKSQVSTNGGVQPRWRADGKELYFLDPGGALMAVTISAEAASVDAGKPLRVFATQVVGGGTGNMVKHYYAVARDGRFLVDEIAEQSAPTPITCF